MAQGPLILLGWLRGPETAGYYRLASSLVLAASQIGQALGRVAYPIFFWSLGQRRNRVAEEEHRAMDSSGWSSYLSAVAAEHTHPAGLGPMGFRRDLPTHGGRPSVHDGRCRGGGGILRGQAALLRLRGGPANTRKESACTPRSCSGSPGFSFNSGVFPEWLVSSQWERSCLSSPWRAWPSSPCGADPMSRRPLRHWSRLGVACIALLVFSETLLLLASRAGGPVDVDIGPSTEDYLSGFAESEERPGVSFRWTHETASVSTFLLSSQGEGAVVLRYGRFPRWNGASTSLRGWSTGRFVRSAPGEISYPEASGSLQRKSCTGRATDRRSRARKAWNRRRLDPLRRNES